MVCWLSRENEVEEVKNEGPKEMTLDEWKAMQDKERTKVEFNIRKPNEGNDGQWKKGYVLHKSKSEDVSMEPSPVAHGACWVVAHTLPLQLQETNLVLSVSEAALCSERLLRPARLLHFHLLFWGLSWFRSQHCSRLGRTQSGKKSPPCHL